MIASRLLLKIILQFKVKWVLLKNPFRMSNMEIKLLRKKILYLELLQAGLKNEAELLTQLSLEPIWATLQPEAGGGRSHTTSECEKRCLLLQATSVVAVRYLELLWQ